MAGCPAVTVLEADGAEREKSGGGAVVVPVPERLTECWLPAALSVMVTDPVRVPAAVGLNVTFTVQLDPAATETQLLVCEKSPEAKYQELHSKSHTICHTGESRNPVTLPLKSLDSGSSPE